MHRISQSNTVIQITGTNATLAPGGKLIIDKLKEVLADSPVHRPTFIDFRNTKLTITK
jgi:hypothetical protein